MNKVDLKFKIGFYDFTLKFFKYVNQEYEGIVKLSERTIEVRDDFDDIATMIIIRHEIIHAILGVQGRYYQQEFNVEELCEFVAYCLPEINEICNYIERELEVK